MVTAGTTTRRIAPIALAALIAALLVGGHVYPGHALVVPMEELGSTSMRQALDGAEARYDRCAIRSRLAEQELRSIRVRIIVSNGRLTQVTPADIPEGRRSRALGSCLRREVRRALRNRRLYRGARQLNLDYRPLRRLSLPMDEPVREMSRLLDANEVSAGVSWLGATRDRNARIDWVRRLEAAGTGVALPDVSTLLSRFQGGRLTAAGLLCRVVVGRRPLRPIMRVLERSDRARFRARTRGRCGTTLASPTPEAPPSSASSPQRPPSPLSGAACTAASDCVLACPGAPSCCVTPCGCNRAILRTDAAANQSYCAANGPAPECPGLGAYGCARQQYHATCRQGRCIAERGHGL